ncbi:MAG: CBS domain-containing protein [Chloroflexi bacterium]|nr:MAG: CBS domain-containing protein [Chloroflexota bacterium]
MATVVRVRIYCDRGDRSGHSSLATAVLNVLWREHASEVTVLDGNAGFGASRHHHSARLADIDANSPVVIEWIEIPSRFAVLWTQVEPLVRDVVVTREQVDLLVAPPQVLPVPRLPGDVPVAEVMRSEVATVRPDTPLTEVVRLMQERDLRFLPVIDDGRLAGVISNADLVARGGLSVPLQFHDTIDAPPGPRAGAVAADVMTLDMVTVPPRMRLPDVARLMLERGVKRIPVIENDRLLGLVSRVDLLRTITLVRPSEVHNPTPVGARTIGEVATASVPTVAPTTPLGEVIEAVASTQLGRAVVVDGDDHVLGVVSDAELLRRVGTDGGVLERLVHRLPRRHLADVDHGGTAADVMETPAVTVPGEMAITEVIALMLETRRKVLPVVDEEGRLRGIVDRSHCLRAAFANER